MSHPNSPTDDLQALRAGDATPVFADPHSRTVLDTLCRIARCTAPVVLVGAPGTGRRHAARLIHRQSGRGGPFVTLDCRGLDPATLERELFGDGARPGRLSPAGTGTLLLEEIGDLPLALQQRVHQSLLQQRLPASDGAATGQGVRLIASVSADLTRAVEAGRFRRDLWARLCVARIVLPPLSERPGDVVALACQFMQRACRRLGRAPVVLGADAIAALRAHAWPGHLLELQQVIREAALRCTGGVLRASDLGLPARTATAPGPEGEAAPTLVGAGAGADLDTALRGLLLRATPEAQAQVEHRLLHQAYDLCGRNQVRTARLLGVSRNVLRRQLLRFGYLTPTGRRRAVRTETLPAPGTERPAAGGPTLPAA